MSRRPLKFDSLPQVLEDVRQLKSGGYEAKGKWNLTQICQHLADWMEFPIQGFPKPPLVIGWILTLTRVTMGKQLLGQCLTSGQMKPGVPTDPRTVHPASPESPESLQAAVDRLEKAVQSFENHQGPIHRSPVFGPMDHETAKRLQLVHCAHHLSFLIPSSAP